MRHFCRMGIVIRGFVFLLPLLIQWVGDVQKIQKSAGFSLLAPPVKTELQGNEEILPGDDTPPLEQQKIMDLVQAVYPLVGELSSAFGQILKLISQENTASQEDMQSRANTLVILFTKMEEQISRITKTVKSQLGLTGQHIFSNRLVLLQTYVDVFKPKIKEWQEMNNEYSSQQEISKRWQEFLHEINSTDWNGLYPLCQQNITDIANVLSKMWRGEMNRMWHDEIQWHKRNSLYLDLSELKPHFEATDDDSRIEISL